MWPRQQHSSSHHTTRGQPVLLQRQPCRRGTPTQAARETSRLTLTSIVGTTTLGDTLNINHRLCRWLQPDASQAPSLPPAANSPETHHNHHSCKALANQFSPGQRHEDPSGSHSNKQPPQTHRALEPAAVPQLHHPDKAPGQDNGSASSHGPVQPSYALKMLETVFFLPPEIPLSSQPKK